ncbi:MAG: glutathione synthase [Candidatus Omnitrophica bacterium]|nr:glutathione synthase [Candidatus Omnitrophota bacterium]
MKFLFLMDPLETIHYKKDTTFIIMLAAFQRGHEVYYVPKNGISLLDSKVYFKTTKIIPQEKGTVPCFSRGLSLSQKKENHPFKKGKQTSFNQDEIDAVFVRFDPPFDEHYLMNTWLLDHLPAHIPVINKPSGIRTVNEKVWVSQFKNITPSTIISSDKNDLIDFVAKHKNIIAKPTNAFGGQGVFHIKPKDTNTLVILETLSKQYTNTIILQKYIPKALQGDKRILLLNGEALGALLRMHPKDEHRNNFFAGGTPKACVITAHDQKIISTLKPYLKKLGLYFVGIDILGDYLIEVNVTSPTCLQEMDRLYNLWGACAKGRLMPRHIILI